MYEFNGGGMNGERAFFEAGTPPPVEDAPAAEAAPAPGGAAPEGGGAEDEQGMLSSLLMSARQVLNMGTLSEQNKLLIEQATTLIQKVMASEEKEMNDAMSGKLSPGILRKAAGGGY